MLIERRAEIALRSLGGPDERKIKQALRVLESADYRDISNNSKIYRALPVQGSKPLYVYRASPRLRLIFAVEEETCTVLDLVDQDRLGRLLPEGGRR